MNRLALVALLCGPSALAAQSVSFDGVWRPGDAQDCTGEGEDGTAIRIDDGVLYGARNECRMTRPLEVRGMAAMLYDMECSGEDGADFTERAMVLKAADGGLYLVWDGYAFKYEACEDGTPVTATGDEAAGE